MSQVQTTKVKNKIHPQKFALYLAIASIIMMFGGLTSAYIVKRSQGMWEVFELPQLFLYSTAAIVLSSVTMFLAVKNFKQEKFSNFRILLLLTLILGIAFSVMQLYGFQDMHQRNILISGNVSGTFIYILAGAHIAHIVGGLIAILYQFIKTRKNTITDEKLAGLDILSTYWHFVDVLWLYLFIFFSLYR